MRKPLRQQWRVHAPVTCRATLAGGSITLSVLVSTQWIRALAGPVTLLSVGDGDTFTVDVVAAEPRSAWATSMLRSSAHTAWRPSRRASGGIPTLPMVRRDRTN